MYIIILYVEAWFFFTLSGLLLVYRSNIYTSVEQQVFHHDNRYNAVCACVHVHMCVHTLYCIIL